MDRVVPPAESAGLTDIERVVPDGHEGLAGAIEESFPGAMWQECRPHFMRRALDRVRDADKGAICEDLRMVLQGGSRQARKRHCWRATGAGNT